LQRVFVHAQLTPAQDRCHVFGSYFWRKLNVRLPAGLAADAREKATVEQVRRWTSKVDIFAKDYLLIPINDADHRTLFVIVNPGVAATAARHVMEPQDVVDAGAVIEMADPREAWPVMLQPAPSDFVINIDWADIKAEAAAQPAAAAAFEKPARLGNAGGGVERRRRRSSGEVAAARRSAQATKALEEANALARGAAERARYARQLAAPAEARHSRAGSRRRSRGSAGGASVRGGELRGGGCACGTSLAASAASAAHDAPSSLAHAHTNAHPSANTNAKADSDPDGRHQRVWHAADGGGTRGGSDGCVLRAPNERIIYSVVYRKKLSTHALGTRTLLEQRVCARRTNKPLAKRAAP